MPIADAAHACPFVAFEDDRDERASVPDHRHRCYAEVRPAPRALAHQEAYCLSSAFPVCPTFQDWARREAARAQDASAAASAASAAEAAAADSPPPAAPPVSGAGSGLPLAAASADVPLDPAQAEPIEPDSGGGGEMSGRGPDADRGYDDDRAQVDQDDAGPRRNPPRDWSAPPPWLASAEAGRPVPTEPPDFLSGRSEPGRGLAGSAADQLAGGPPPPRRVAPASAYQAPPRDHADPGAADDPEFEEADQRRGAVPPRPAAPPRRPRAYDQHLGGPSTGPDWERPRRYEAYPTIKTRMGLPAIPRLAAMAAAVAIAAVALFFLPALLGVGSDEEAGGSPTPAARPSSSIAPTPTPAPTPIIYVIKKGDFLNKVAAAHGITLEELLAANPDIKDPNKIVEGQQIIIPAPSQAPPEEFGGSAAPSAGASP
jgi:hypothetical protein